MKDLQTVLDALEGMAQDLGKSLSEVPAIAIVDDLMAQEPVAWINWNAATGARTVSFEQESELASQPLYYTPVTGDDLAEMTDLKEEREHQRDSAVETVRELVKQRDALRAELGEYPEIQAMLMSDNKQLRAEVALFKSRRASPAVQAVPAEPSCPDCNAPHLLYECVHCSASNYPAAPKGTTA